MKGRNGCCTNSLESKIKSLIEKRGKITFRELLKEVNISTEELEDFLVPLLGEGTIEGRLELHCPDCGADLGSFKQYKDIPSENECEICGHSFPTSEDYLDILLEVKGKFFRG